MDNKQLKELLKKAGQKDKKHLKVNRAYQKQKAKDAKNKALESKKEEKDLYHGIISEGDNK